MPLFDYQCPNGHVFERYTKKRDFVPKCPECGEKGEKIWTSAISKSGEAGNEYPKRTKDITGKWITLTDAAHEKRVLNEHFERTGERIRKRDDAGFLDKTHEGLDWKTGQPVYREGSGLGTPGCWGGLPASHPHMMKLQKERYQDEEE